MTQEQVIYEAKQALKPWTCVFEKVDWYTLYKIHLAVAQNFVRDDVFVIVRDACHIHSAGNAQGMNTLIYDATNLAWKLAGVVKGHYDPKTPRSYESERREVAQHLIMLDGKMSVLITREVSYEYKSK